MPIKASSRDMIIIGAGLAGSSLATALAELGWGVLLIERDTFPRHKVCGEFLSPESQASFQALGLYGTVNALAPAVIGRAKLVTASGAAVTLELPGQAWGLSRYTMDETLAATAQQAGAELLTGVTATGLERAGPEFRVTLRSRQGNQVVPARAVIAACGRYSRPGLPPRARVPGRRQGYVGVKCHYTGVAMPDQVELFLFPGGYAGVSPIEGGRVNCCLLVSQAAFRQAGKSVRQMIEAAAAWNPALARRLAPGQALPETEAAVAPVDPYRPAAPWDGVACLGDTAVMIPPLCGDGMAMALRSAELTAPLAHDFLGGRLSLGGWEESYRQRWQAEFSRPVWIGRALQTALGVPLLANSLLRLGHMAPPLANWLVRATRGRGLLPQARVQGIPQPVTDEVEGEDDQENSQAG